MDLFNLYSPFNNCCDENNETYISYFDLDYHLSMEEVKQCTTNKDYVLFNSRIKKEKCYFHGKHDPNIK